MTQQLFRKHIMLKSFALYVDIEPSSSETAVLNQSDFE